MSIASLESENDAEGPGPLFFPVVGIGASAGGLAALQRFFEHVPPDSGMAYVVVLHLSADYESHIAPILQRATSMQVAPVNTKTSIKPNCVYVISPANDLVMEDGALDVRPSRRLSGPATAIDVFFRTLAEAHGARAVGIVMSGTGSDGSVGLGRIKECAGVTFVQRPEEAEYDQMPRNAIATGLVDFILPVASIADKLSEVWLNARTIELPMEDGLSFAPVVPANAHAESSAEEALKAILRTLHARTGHDFLHYKRSTVLRRIERRLQVNALRDLPAYARFLDENVAETTALLKDMLIGVTNFYRDAEPFAAFERKVVPQVFEDGGEAGPIRAWVAACSTGQEAYSVAILLSERAAKEQPRRVVQLFATDIDQSAINVARSGNYPDSIRADVSAERLDAHFSQVDGRYIVRKGLREKILFAAHNLLSDPPFSRLDVVTCRNLLIYLDRTVQRQVLQTFHFALEPGGFLFLGNAESADVADDLFVAVDKKNRIYRAKTLTTRPRRRTSVPSITHYAPHVASAFSPKPVFKREMSTPTALHQRLSAQAAGPSILVDRDAEILHASEDARRYLQFPSGESARSLLSAIHPDLRAEVQTGLYRVFQEGGTVDISRVQFTQDAQQVFVHVNIQQFQDENGSDVALLLFKALPDADTSGLDIRRDGDEAYRALDQELQRVRGQLQLSVEQSSVMQEELKAANEELQSLVEELRSSGEELETSKEELQALNEELLTTNSELQFKVAEADREQDDLDNLIASSGIATVFVDGATRIKRYTAPALKLFGLIATDVGRPLLDLVPRLDYPELAADVRAAFEELRLVEREVSNPQGEWFLARLQPYRTQADYIGGVVLTFVDITARKTAQEAAAASDDRLKLAALATNDYAIIVQDVAGTIVSWNRGAVRVFGYEEREAVGQRADLIFSDSDKALGAPRMERELARVTGRADDERWHVRKDGTEIYCSGVMTAIDTPSFKGFAKIARDLTDRKSIENQQQLQLTQERAIREQAEAAVRLKDEFFAVLSHELKNPLNLIHVKAELLSRSPKTRGIDMVHDAADAIKRSVLAQSKIIDDLLDLSRIRTGKLSLQMAPVDLAEVVRSVMEASAADAEKVGVRLEMTLDADAVPIYADGVRVEQVVWNLMRNALKFTPPGGVVSVSLTHVQGVACIAVCDTGQGIAPAFLPKIFEMFSQAEGGGRRNAGGLGIGLSIVKQVAEMHGGHVTIHSAGEGQGTQCRLWLPEGAPHAIADGRDGLGSGKAFHGLKVLLVDDAEEALEALSGLLEIEGAEVFQASTAERGLEIAAEHPLHVIVSDIGMPTMDGYAFLAALRAKPATVAIPVIALTGFGRKQDAAKVLQAGFSAHLGKPASFQDLLSVIAAYVPKANR